MTKEKAYYQAYLILEHLPKEEYDLIPKDMIEEIEDKMEYDENITIDLSTNLENQKIDEKTYGILEKVIKAVEKSNKSVVKKLTTNNTRQGGTTEIHDYIEKCKTENELFDTQIEMIRLNKIIEALKNENGKIDEAKNLIIGYRDVAMSKDEEIKNLNGELEKMKKDNEELLDMLKKVPKFIRKIFLKDDVKLLKN